MQACAEPDAISLAAGLAAVRDAEVAAAAGRLRDDLAGQLAEQAAATAAAAGPVRTPSLARESRHATLVLAVFDRALTKAAAGHRRASVTLASLLSTGCLAHLAFSSNRLVTGLTSLAAR